MGLIIITIIFLIISIILIIYGRCKYNFAEEIGVFILTCTMIVGLIEGLILIWFKPVDEIEFKSKYQTVKEMKNNRDDMRDTNYTKNLIEINETITTERIMIDNKWIGIFHSKEISDLELLGKTEE